MGLLAEQLTDHGLDSGDSGGTTNEDHLVDIGCSQTGITKSILDRELGALDQVGDELFELCSRKSHLQVFRTGAVSSDEGQVDVGTGRVGELDLRLLGCFTQSLQSHLVA